MAYPAWQRKSTGNVALKRRQDLAVLHRLANEARVAPRARRSCVWWLNFSLLLIPANIEGWLAMARAFGRQTDRKTGMIANSKTFILDSGRRYPLSRLESRCAG